MGSNNNIFYASNPARMTDALWHVISADNGVESMADMLIFVPSRRAVRSIEKMIVDRVGGAVILPRLVALGEADDAADQEVTDVISDMARVVVLAQLIAADANVRTIGAALPIARDLVRMTDYLENEGINIANVDWDALVDDRYAAHFRRKSDLLKIVSKFASMPNRQTATQRRNADIRAWIGTMGTYARVIVCGSTASVPATADLMVHIAHLSHGRIILPGKICGGDPGDFELATNPYNSEYKFLSRMGIDPQDVREIDVGVSSIDFFNGAFSNTHLSSNVMPPCRLIDAPRESLEASCAAEIAARAVGENKTVLIITPDAAGNQRLATALAARGLNADFSGGISGASTPPGRAILNLFDDWIDQGMDTFDKLFSDQHDLFSVLAKMIDGDVAMAPAFDASDPAWGNVWRALYELGQIVGENKIDLSVYDARALVADCLGAVSVRPPMNDAARVVVLGTIESRMQTADVVILTGLNDGMFPARGYENAWLPRAVADKIGLPPPDRKVSLMALDFMTLSCGDCVYWLHSRTAGGVATTPSRFLSRVAVAGRRAIETDRDILNAAMNADRVGECPLCYDPPMPPADQSDVYVTELELLIHNPYAFYARHILRLNPLDDYWVGADARTFGTLVHAVIEGTKNFSPDALVAEMDRRAAAEIGDDSVLYHFWHRRFMEMAPVIAQSGLAGDLGWAEIAGSMRLGGRTIRARADRVWGDAVMDIKTGAAPTKSQLLAGTMPQLPLEAIMLSTGGFAGVSGRAQTPAIRFLQLRTRDVRVIEYTDDTARAMMDAARDRITQLFAQYGHDGVPYPYLETGNLKYNAWDDLARVDD